MVNTDERPDEILRELFPECLRHFAEWFNSRVKRKSPGRIAQMQKMLDFLGVTDGAVQSWFAGRNLPKGILRLKMYCYLDMYGYRVIEFERMEAFVRNFAELIGFGLITKEQAVELVGFNKISRLFEVIYTNSNVGEDKKLRMWDAWKERKFELDKVKKEAWHKYRLPVLFKKPRRLSTAKAEETPRAPDPVNQDVSGAIGANLKAQRIIGFHAIRSVRILFDAKVFENLSDEDLAEIHPEDRQSILRLGAHLNMLNSKLITTSEGGSIASPV